MHNLIAVLVLAAATSYRPYVPTAAAVDPLLLQRRDAIAANLSPSARQKMHAIALSVAKSPAMGDGGVRSALTATFPNLSTLEGADISALVFIVMMDAAQSMQQDLKTIMDGVKDINKQKDALRGELSRLNQFKPAVRRTPPTASASFMMPPPLPPNATIAQKQHRYDELSDLSDSLQLKIQTLNSQMQNAQQMASNVIKGVNDSRASVLKNLK